MTMQLSLMLLAHKVAAPSAGCCCRLASAEDAWQSTLFQEGEPKHDNGCSGSRRRRQQGRSHLQNMLEVRSCASPTSLKILNLYIFVLHMRVVSRHQQQLCCHSPLLHPAAKLICVDGLFAQPLSGR